MKVEGPGSVKPGALRKADKTRKAGDSAFADALREAGDGDSIAQTKGVSGVDGVFVVQTLSGDPDEQARQRGRSILDRLDEIRHSLLTGQLRHGDLLRLKQSIDLDRAELSDPNLSQVLDEIDLRAQVELAKYERDL